MKMAALPDDSPLTSDDIIDGMIFETINTIMAEEEFSESDKTKTPQDITSKIVIPNTTNADNKTQPTKTDLENDFLLQMTRLFSLIASEPDPNFRSIIIDIFLQILLIRTELETKETAFISQTPDDIAMINTLMDTISPDETDMLMSPFTNGSPAKVTRVQFSGLGSSDTDDLKNVKLVNAGDLTNEEIAPFEFHIEEQMNGVEASNASTTAVSSKSSIDSETSPILDFER
jgi:hypothetical protein